MKRAKSATHTHPGIAMGDRAYPVGPLTPQTPSVSAGASTARVTLPAEGFALANLFECIPDARVEVNLPLPTLTITLC